MKGISLIFLTVCVALAVANGREFELKPRVVGGHNAQLGQFPYQASLRFRVLRAHFCGASIISNRYLLTAGHCTTGLRSSPYFFVAVVGNIHQHMDGVTYSLDKVMRHEKYDPKVFDYDISLLRTAKEIQFTANIQPINLPTKNDNGNTKAIFSGYGTTSFPRVKLPKTLQYAETHTLKVKECRDWFAGQDVPEIPFEKIVCTLQHKGVGACSGDSGGPLAVYPNKETLLGIASFVVPCGVGAPDAFTRVYSYLDWIKEHMEQ